MNILKYIFLLNCIFLLVFAPTCTNQNNDQEMRNWSNIIKDLEIILASDVADSVKAFQIKVLFESNHITLADYREFYDKSTQEKPLKSLDHLKKVEQFIGEDMKKEAQQQRKKTNIIKYNPREEDSPKDRN